MAATAAFITEGAGSVVLGIQGNIRSDNQMMIEAQAIFDDVFAIESPKQVGLPSVFPFCMDHGQIFHYVKES